MRKSHEIESGLPLVRFFPGDGTEVSLPVLYIAEFARGPDGTCAFCEGDPCAEFKGANDRIKAAIAGGEYSCPFCNGRPS